MSDEFVSSLVISNNYRFKSPRADYDYLFYGGFQSARDKNSRTTDRDGLEYVHNSYGFRSVDFTEDADSIFAGCSHTYGVGTRFEENWSGQLASMLDVPQINIGHRGASVETIVSNVFEYIKLFGKPKNIFCMFPDFERIPMFLNQNILVSKHGQDDGYKDIQMGHLNNLDRRPDFIKKPFSVEDVLSMEAPVYSSLSAIRRLEQYCNDTGITLLWSLFSSRNHAMMEKLVEDKPGSYKFFVDTTQSRWIRDVENFVGDRYMDNPFSGPNGKQILCHESLRELHQDTFDHALDTSPDGDKRGSHLGVHRQYHAAEELYKAYLDGKSV